MYHVAGLRQTGWCTVVLQAVYVCTHPHVSASVCTSTVPETKSLNKHGAASRKTYAFTIAVLSILFYFLYYSTK